MQRDGALYGLGVISLVFGDFALQWQSVPDGMPMREALIWINGLIMIGAGIAILLPRTSRWGAIVLTIAYATWVLAHLPKVAAAPANVAEWLGVAEALALSSAGLVLVGLNSADARLTKIARYAFGICPLIFGLSHFVYADFTATMVPAFMPAPLVWAWLTGAGHVAAGVAILSGVLARLGAGLLALMCASFVVLLHLPRVIAAPESHAEWTMTAVALSLTGAAVVIWRSLSRPA